jgi:hypothetical protein
MSKIKTIFFKSKEQAEKCYNDNNDFHTDVRALIQYLKYIDMYQVIIYRV